MQILSTLSSQAAASRMQTSTDPPSFPAPPARMLTHLQSTAAILASPLINPTEESQTEAANALHAITPLWQNRERPFAAAVAAAVITQTAGANLRAAASVLSHVCDHLAELLRLGLDGGNGQEGGGVGRAAKRGREVGSDRQVAAEKLEAGVQLVVLLGGSCEGNIPLQRLLSALSVQVEAFRPKLYNYGGSKVGSAQIELCLSSSPRNPTP